MSETVTTVVSLVLLLVGAVILPWIAMRAIVPALEASGRGSVENYSGRRVVVGLGLVWLIWVLALQMVTLVDALYASLFSAEGVPIFVEFAVDGLPFVLILGTLALGMADDFLGSPADKGFGGHLSALFQGRLTTGMLKLLGIGILAIFATMPDFSGMEVTMWSSLGEFLGQVGSSFRDFGGLDVTMWTVVRDWALQVLAIALTANLINLTDLRPGRALKVYSLFAAFACVVLGFSWAWNIVPFFMLISFGPVLAVWSFDLRERAMLGDAGANVFGAFAGWMIAIALSPWWWALALYVLIVLVKNALSEKISFSAVIEKVGPLRWLDGIGRLKEPNVAATPGPSGKTSSASGSYHR